MIEENSPAVHVVRSHPVSGISEHTNVSPTLFDKHSFLDVPTDLRQIS